jgi:hypothetical protein
VSWLLRYGSSPVPPCPLLQGSGSLASQLAPLVSELGTELAAAVAEEGRSAELRGQWSEASVAEELALGAGQVGAEATVDCRSLCMLEC